MALDYLHFIIGTKAQLIKMAPLMIRAAQKGIPFTYIDSGQHADTTDELRKAFNLPEPDVKLFSHKDDIATIPAAIKWAAKLSTYRFTPKHKALERFFLNKKGICLVHGDTLSTMFGVWLAKSAGLPAAHIESGLRSHNIFNPFPEELVRIYCMKNCDFLFAPSEQAYKNLIQMKVKGEIHHVDGNTVVDSLRLVADNLPPPPLNKFALTTCHRYETITNKARLTKVVELLNEVSKQTPVIFVVHKPTINQIKKFNLLDTISSNIKLMDMQNYASFQSLVFHSDFVITDGGSIQEECAYLDKPCLIIRNHTERNDGIGKNATLWKFDVGISGQFLRGVSHQQDNNQCDWPSPSEEIINVLGGKLKPLHRTDANIPDAEPKKTVNTREQRESE
jgi:UDP-N-acetylglucosamine 2-epimerase (non-hydrolysing)